MDLRFPDLNRRAAAHTFQAALRTFLAATALVITLVEFSFVGQADAAGLTVHVATVF